MRLLKRIYDSELDRHLDVRKKSFIAYLIFQFIFTFITLGIAINYPDNRTVYLSSSALTFIVPALALIFTRKYFEQTVRVFASYSWCTTLLFLLLVEGNNASNALIGVVFLTVCLYSTLLINLRWGGVFIVLTVIAFAVDYLVEDALPGFGFQTREISKFDYLFLFLCFFMANAGFILVFSYLLSNSLREYNAEVALRKNAQKELEDVNMVLKEMNADLEEHTASLEEVNSKLASYAHKNAHEIRAPLCRLQGLVYLIDKVESEEEVNYIMRQIKDSTNELNSVIHKMNELLQEDNIIRLDQ